MACADGVTDRGNASLVLTAGNPGRGFSFARSGREMIHATQTE